MDKEIIELGKFFFTNISKTLDTANTKAKWDIINQIADSGIPCCLLQEIMIDYNNLFHTPVSNLTPILSAYRSSLLKPDHFYYHPRLQVSSEAPRLKQLYNGEFIELNTNKFTLRNFRLYTIENLCTHYYTKMGSGVQIKLKDNVNMKQLYQACNQDLDLTMYTIDVGTSIVLEEGKRLMSILFLSDYMPQGQDILDDRISNCKAVNLNHEYQ